MASEHEPQEQPAALAVDPEADESDSALGGSIAESHSASLTSTVLNYKYENGRRYHAYREGAYFLPNDESEQARLDLLHHVFRMINGGDLHCAPLKESGQLNRVLDLGTGTGIWAMDFADEYPMSVVIGNDLSPIQPTWVPPNCQFYVEDIEGQWNYAPDETFNYIHARGLGGSIVDFKKLFRQAYENLKPGGWFEIQEFENKVGSDDGTLGLVRYLTDWTEQLDEASKKFGRPLSVTPQIKAWIEEAGFINVQDKIVKVPIGTWPKNKTYKNLGLFYLALFLDTVEPATLALFTRVLNFSTEQAQIIVANVKSDLPRRGAHVWVRAHCIWGQKPE